MQPPNSVMPFLRVLSCQRQVIPGFVSLHTKIFTRSIASFNQFFVRPNRVTSSPVLGWQSHPTQTNRSTLANTRFKGDSTSTKVPKDILLSTTKNGVTILTMNQPKKLNGWTGPMMFALKDAFLSAAKDDNTKVTILTGADPYYCAGVNLSDTIKPMHPATLHKLIVENNSAIFNAFIDFPKPLIIAANGPAIGACVTSATLADCIIASEKATFSTPFARLGVTPEGCSSVHFERIMGKENAAKMLGPEGWTPTAAEAKLAGFVSEVVPHEQLLARAQEVAEQVNKIKFD